MIAIRQTALGNLSPLKRVLVSEGGLGKPQQTGFCLSWKNFRESQGKLEVTGGNDPSSLLHEPLGSCHSSSFPVSLLTNPLLKNQSHSSILATFITAQSMFLPVTMMKFQQNQSMI